MRGGIEDIYEYIIVYFHKFGYVNIPVIFGYISYDIRLTVCIYTLGLSIFMNTRNYFILSRFLDMISCNDRNALTQTRNKIYCFL